MTIDSKIKNKNPSTKANENEIDTGSNLNSLLIDEDKTKKLKNALIKLTRQKTVPQIFINGSFIGGFTDLDKLLSNEMFKLEKKLSKI